MKEKKKKRLFELKMRDRFRFPKEDEIYVFSYRVDENQVAIIAEKDLGKEGGIKRVSANSKVIPEKGNRLSK